jgi:hypothetical protein
VIVKTFEQRLADLERSNRHWKAAAMGLGGVLLAISSIAAALPSFIPDVLYARRLEIVNDQGQRVAIVGQVNGQGTLSLYNRDGKMQMLTSATNSGGLMSLWNGDQQLLRAGNNGAGGTIDLIAATGQEAVRMGAASGQSGYVGVADGSGGLMNVGGPITSPIVVPATTSDYGTNRWFHDKFTD